MPAMLVFDGAGDGVGGGSNWLTGPSDEGLVWLYIGTMGIGRDLSVKTSPERRRGILWPNSEVRMLRASVLIGSDEGVCLLLGCIVTQSTSGSWGSPITVFRKSKVFLEYILVQ